ncbi:YciI family protein [Pseudocolwellia agarivorans]|uniref:YciI family protein n=1 Tax=Pseudocolwellia agarivorans TaxID=1911682 RepID=UPI000986B5E2|nr:YciI family protein [Pseudocolwellia agarivorans]
MLVMFNCMDKENQQNKRFECLKDHLLWVENNMSAIKVAGPQLHPHSDRIIGSFYIIEANTIEDAHMLFQTDPYYMAGIWKVVSTAEFKGYAGTWVGGKNWPEF